MAIDSPIGVDVFVVGGGMCVCFWHRCVCVFGIGVWVCFLA